VQLIKVAIEFWQTKILITFKSSRFADMFTQDPLDYLHLPKRNSY